MPTIEERLEALEAKEARLQTLEDKEAIRRLIHAYGREMDYGRDGDAWNDLYTGDGIWQGTPVTGTAGIGVARIEGHAALREWWLRGGRAEPDYWGPGHRASQHCMVMIDIELEGDRATVHSYGILMGESVNGPMIGVMGRYTDLVVRCPDGRWRFKKRHLERTCTVPRMQVRPMETPGPAETRAGREQFLVELAEAAAKREPWREDFKAEVERRKAAVARPT